MYSRRVVNAHPGRITPFSIRQAQAKQFFSTSAPSSKLKQLIYSAIAATTGTAAGLWWLTHTPDKVPSLKNQPTAELAIKPGPTHDEVSRIIAQNAFSFRVRTIAGLSRYDGAQLASNSACEDRYLHGKFPSPRNDGSQWMAWAVFDGHAGWQTAELLKEQLLSFVQHVLNQAVKEKSLTTEVVQWAIKQAFLNLDDCVMNMALDAIESTEPLQDKVKKLVTVYAGSCASLCIYDPVTNYLYAACTGDSRLVLGRKNNGHTWEAISLSEDQTGSNKSEIARLNDEHPGEENIVKDGRVLGMMVSRAFGDGRWKLPLQSQQVLKSKFYGPALLSPQYDLRTPPYLTAEPTVKTIKIEPGQPAFVVVATDGMWDTVSSQQAIDLVGKWLESREVLPGTVKPPIPIYEHFDFGQFSEGVNWKFVEARTTIQDDNVAVHLVRNALGGNHHELIASRLAFEPPFSRRLRDDMTVQVAFFNFPGLQN